MASELLSELDTGGVLRLTMNRPEVHNAFDDAQISRLSDALAAAADNPEVRVLVLAGSGKSFSAGGDINYMRRMGEYSYAENLEDGGRLAALMQALNCLPKPTIARVHGAAMGGGVGLVSCCDFAIGTPRTRLALTEVKLGLAPATIAPYVVNTIGEKAARRLFLSARSVDAEEALRLGFITELVPEESLDEAITTLAVTLLQNSPNGMRASKQLAMDVSREPIEDAMIEKTVSLIADLRDSAEGKEGLSAFLEKRKPGWQPHQAED
jgi:methylglutaconyl-CoA hydratase